MTKDDAATLTRDICTVCGGQCCNCAQCIREKGRADVFMSCRRKETEPPPALAKKAGAA